MGHLNSTHRPFPRGPLSSLLAVAALACAALQGGCRNDAMTAGPAAIFDAGPPTPDLSCVEQACVAEKDEDCGGCMRHIGECCYKDKAWTSTPALVNSLVNSCSDIPSCAACCNECLAMPCDQLIKRGNCPYDP